MSRTKQKEKAPADSPPDEFCAWWNPTGTQQPSGADVGGHPDARRVWARKDPGRWTRRTYGLNAITAWQCQCYRSEFNAWIGADRPEGEPFVSLAATLERQGEMWREMKSTLAKIGKKVPSTDEPARRKLLQEQKVKLLNEPGVIDAEFTKVDDDDAIDFNHREYPK